jgi:hypothetical protein
VHGVQDLVHLLLREPGELPLGGPDLAYNEIYFLTHGDTIGESEK